MALPILVVSGTSTIIVVSASSMVLQHLVPEHLRGRVMAMCTMSFFGMLPLSVLVAGGIAHVARVQRVFIVAGLGTIVVGHAFRRQLPRLRDLARPVLVERGLLPSLRLRPGLQMQIADAAAARLELFLSAFDKYMSQSDPALTIRRRLFRKCEPNCRSGYVEIAFPGTNWQPLTFQLLSGWRCMV